MPPFYRRACVIAKKQGTPFPPLRVRNANLRGRCRACTESKCVLSVGGETEGVPWQRRAPNAEGNGAAAAPPPSPPTLRFGGSTSPALEAQGRKIRIRLSELRRRRFELHRYAVHAIA